MENHESTRIGKTVSPINEVVRSPKMETSKFCRWVLGMIAMIILAANYPVFAGIDDS